MIRVRPLRRLWLVAGLLAGPGGAIAAAPPVTPTAAGAAACACAAPEDLELLQALRARRLALDAREAELAQREAAAQELESRLLGEIDRLVQSINSAPGAAVDAKAVTGLDAVFAAVAGLPARKAAPLVEGLPVELAVVILNRLGPERTGDLLSRINGARATVLLQAMAGERRQSSSAATVGVGASTARAPGARGAGR